jgi:hypothetical protein
METFDTVEDALEFLILTYGENEKALLAIQKIVEHLELQMFGTINPMKF